MKLINIGFSNFVAAGRIIAVLSPDAAPVKRMVAEAKTRQMLIDATSGRRTRSVIALDSGHIVLCFMECERIHTAVNQEADV